ncbi:MAG: DUF177 domain-containing protein [Nitrospirae bacterium]|nr:DUF177 domain-containing protein [Nitrospirota bacterium]
MKILIADIPEEGLSVDLEENIQADSFSVVAPVVSRVQLTKAGGEVIVSGNLGADIEVQCSRCLRDFRQRLDLPVNVVYHPIEEFDEGAEGHPARHVLSDDEMDMGFYRAGELDLDELLREQIILNIQMKPLCDSACKGLCPTCGIDLNTGSCNCAADRTDPRLAVLKKLLNDRKE